MGQLTTHVLDTVAGVPAAGVRIDLHELPSGGDRQESALHGGGPQGGPPREGDPRLLSSVTTGSDGRCPGPLVAGEAFRAGRYSLTFHMGDYFRGRGVDLPDPAFIEDAVIRIGIANAGEHYHVPLLASPWSYSVYRGG